MIKKLLFIFSLSIPITAIGDIYKWIDPTGKTWYTDEQKNEHYVKIIKTNQITFIEKIVIKKAVEDNLKDPYSAHFKWKKYISTFIDYKSKLEGDTHYCAFVNAKNSFGGYNGFTPFEVTLNKLENEWIVTKVDIGNHISCYEE